MKKLLIIGLFLPLVSFSQSIDSVRASIQQKVELTRFEPVQIPGNQFYKLQMDISKAGDDIHFGSNCQKLGYFAYLCAGIMGVVGWQVPEAQSIVYSAIGIGTLGTISYVVGTFKIGNGGKKLSQVKLNRINP